MSLSNIFMGSTMILALSQTVTGFMVSSKNSRIEMLTAQIEVQESNNKKCLHSLSIQNKAVTDLEVNLNTSMEKWRNRPTAISIVDRWHTKYIDRNVTEKRGTCEEDKLIFNAIRNSGF